MEQSMRVQVSPLVQGDVMGFEKEEFEKNTPIFYVTKDKYGFYQISKATVRWKRDYGFMNITHYYIQEDRKTIIDSEFVFGSVNDAKEYILEKLVEEEFIVQQEIERIVNLNIDGT
jgi:hypothetical protein